MISRAYPQALFIIGDDDRIPILMYLFQTMSPPRFFQAEGRCHVFLQPLSTFPLRPRVRRPPRSKIAGEVCHWEQYFGAVGESDEFNVYSSIKVVRLTIINER